MIASFVIIVDTVNETMVSATGASIASVETARIALASPSADLYDFETTERNVTLTERSAVVLGNGLPDAKTRS